MKIPTKKIDLEDMLWDLDRFPLPICFDPIRERQQFWLRDNRVKAIHERYHQMIKK